MELMNELTVDEIIERTIKEYEKKQKRKVQKRSFRNTKLLMENYNDFKKHIDYSVADIKDIQGIVTMDLQKNNCDELFILSIKQSKAKTLIMTSHIEKSLELLEIEQKRVGTIERYQALEMYYIENKSYERIAEELNTGKNTPSRWVKQMLDRLGVLLFGIDGIKLE